MKFFFINNGNLYIIYIVYTNNGNLYILELFLGGEVFGGTLKLNWLKKIILNIFKRVFNFLLSCKILRVLKEISN